MDSLQFQKAEYAGDAPLCAACRNSIDREYYQLAGADICPACAERARSARQAPSNTAMLRGLMYGAGAAFVCFVGYAIFIMATGIEFGLVAVAVGWLVGKAVRAGTGGLGGRRAQILAVALTYIAITFAYVPIMVRGAIDPAEPEERIATGPVVTAERPTAGAIGAAIPVMVGLALALPFLELTSGVSGILGIIIIGVGLLQAWRLTAGDARPLTGPFEREGAASVG